MKGKKWYIERSHRREAASTLSSIKANSKDNLKDNYKRANKELRIKSDNRFRLETMKDCMELPEGKR
ncbi:hypothetical protein IPA_08000 [Ignicoccus pacificus DSM 13166]|uniref:Uncharacterized protein n=1 Tax=Ignicoccus pacificus DSM 13166 TaxID=940294 RepID=A0A977PL93_9CREN|nr:hypothetical protein IPA_08000 [Ignicoccus pacificus DSM 13166]